MTRKSKLKIEFRLVDFMNKFAYQKTNLLCPSDDLDFHNKSFKEQVRICFD